MTDSTPSPTVAESVATSRGGVGYLILEPILLLAAAAVIALGVAVGSTGLLVVCFAIAAILAIVFLVVAASFYMIAPNQAAVLSLFGAYRGTDRNAGLRIANPLYTSTKISLRVRNFTTSTSKVNDANGNPIHIAAVVVWRVVDTARASFGVDDFTDYVHIQSESAVRQLARSYPYDSFDDAAVTTLIGDTGEVNEHLMTELQERADAAGVEVIEARVTDLSYAAEIAEAMLRRQQASAIVAGRAKIVEGAVWMVRQAIRDLEAGDGDGEQAVTLSPERRASFAANLMTVIASDSPTTPVVDVGSNA